MAYLGYISENSVRASMKQFAFNMNLNYLELKKQNKKIRTSTSIPGHLSSIAIASMLPFTAA